MVGALAVVDDVIAVGCGFSASWGVVGKRRMGITCYEMEEVDENGPLHLVETQASLAHQQSIRAAIEKSLLLYDIYWGLRILRESPVNGRDHRQLHGMRTDDPHVILGIGPTEYLGHRGGGGGKKSETGGRQQ